MINPTTSPSEPTSALDIVRHRLRALLFLPNEEQYPERYVFLLLSFIVMVKIFHVLMRQRRELIRYNQYRLALDIEQAAHSSPASNQPELEPESPGTRLRLQIVGLGMDGVIPGARGFLTDGRLPAASFNAAASAFRPGVRVHPQKHIDSEDDQYRVDPTSKASNSPPTYSASESAAHRSALPPLALPIPLPVLVPTLHDIAQSP